MSTLQKLSITAASATLLTLSTVAPAIAASFYSITDLGSDFYPKDFNDKSQVLGVTGSQTLLYDNGNKIDLTAIGATGINNLGEAIGFSGGNLYQREPDGTINILSQPDPHSCTGYYCQYSGAFRGAFDINDSGQVLAKSSFLNPADDSLILRDKDGSVSTLMWNGSGTYFQLAALNNKGQVALSGSGGHSSVQFIDLWDKGTYENVVSSSHLMQLDLYNITTLDVNDLSQVVYSAYRQYPYEYPPQPETGFLWSKSSTTNLGTLGGKTSKANSINNLTQVVGTSQTSLGAGHAFLWENNIMTDLNSLIDPNSGWELLSASEINNQGDIVGTGKFNGQEHGFLLKPVSELKPVPEPTSVLGLLTFGACGVGFRLLGKRKSSD